MSHVLGWPSHAESLPPLYSLYLSTKAQYPDKVIAVRSAECYNFVGIDAVIVCEKLDLKGFGIATNASGPSDCPLTAVIAQNASRDFYRLCTEHNLDVVVCEVKKDKAKGKAQARFVQQICTPHNPHYRFGAAQMPEGVGDGDISVIGVPPLRPAACA